MSKRTIQRAPALRGNRFHQCSHDRREVLVAAEELRAMLDELPPEGLAEKPLLQWFGASTQRMALLAHSVGVLHPTHVARELELGEMRADFALLSVPDVQSVAPRLLLVECQGAGHRTLFESRDRAMLHWGRDFLDGFGQLVDWHFAEHYSLRHQALASLTAAAEQPLEVSFLLVAGLRRFVRDSLSQRRLAWWCGHIRPAPHFYIKRFDDVAHEASHWARQMRDWPALSPMPGGIGVSRADSCQPA